MLVATVAVAGACGHFFFRDYRRHGPPFVVAAAEMLVDSIPAGPPGAEVLARRAEDLQLNITLWAPDGSLRGHAGSPSPAPTSDDPAFEWSGPGHPEGLRLRMPDGHFLAVSTRAGHGGPRAWRFLLVFALLLVVLSLASYLLARRMTRRLEHLQAGVERLGAGELHSRVAVGGHDEVSELATAFNATAARIEALVQQQQRMLASASHELRAPLARLRMALALLLDSDPAAPDVARRAEMLADAERDIEELDGLVDDVLLAARLQAPNAEPEFAAVDLDELVAQQAQGAGVAVEGSAGMVRGDRRMLRRLVRNLIDNALKYGQGDAATGEQDGVLVTLGRAAGGDGGTVSLRVCDRGPGVPEADRDRIFEAFYRPQGHAETRDGGVGLGLSLVRQIAEHHGGHAHYAPREGGGSCFEVTLPTGN